MCTNPRLKTVLFLTVFLWSSLTGTVFGHEAGAPFSGAIPEPIIVHHAHIEDEQRINFTFFDGFHTGAEKRSAYFNTLELAFDWTGDFRIGSEIFIPFSNKGNSKNQYDIGDIELQMIKYAFINEAERILTGVFSIELPTGNESLGLGTNQTKLGGLLFLDQAYRNWYLGINAEFVSTIAGPASTEFEGSLALSYSFIHETGKGIAPTKPHQFIVPTLLMELITETVLKGEEQGKNAITLLPGLQLWHPDSDWTFKVGIQFPISSGRENNFAVHFQIGNHFDWGRLLGLN